MKINRRNLCAGMLCLGMLSVASNAAEINYELRGGLTLSDNVNRGRVVKTDDAILSVGGIADITHDSSHVDFDLFADLDVLYYVDNTFNSEVVGALDADLAVDFVQDTLSWVTENRFGTLRTNPLQSGSPGNRENINSFSTGPELDIRFSSVTTLNIGARYRNNAFDVRDTDNDVIAASVSLRRALSRHRTISLNLTQDDVDYDNDLFNQDFERRAAFVRFRSAVSRGTLSLSVGANEVDVDGQSTDGTLLDFSFNRRLSERTTLGLRYDQRYSDAGDIFRRGESNRRGFYDTQTVGGLGSPFEHRRIEVSVDVARSSGSVFAALRHNDESYETFNELNRDMLEGRFNLDHRFRQNWRMEFGARVAKIDYRDLDREDDDLSITVSVGRRLSRVLHADLRYAYLDRSSTDPFSEFSENRISLVVTYARRGFDTRDRRFDR